MAKTYEEYMRMAAKAHDAGEAEHARQLVQLAKQARTPALELPKAPAQHQELTLIGVGVAAGIGTLGWLLARRTLLAARPKLSRKWFGMFGPTVWKCARCGTVVALRADRCGACGQYQKWPKWSTES